MICILGTGGKILFAQNSDSLYISPNNTSTPKQVTVNNIFIVGNEKTRKNIILREMNLAENVTYNWDEFVNLVEADQKKIYNLRLFTTATVTPLFVGEEQVEILVSLKERWYILPSIIFNLADRNFSEWWSNQNRDFSRVNYGIKLDHNNIGGRNEKLRVIGQVGFTQAILLNYTIPYFDKNQLHGLAAKFRYNTNKNIPIKSVGNKQYFYRNPEENILKKTLATSLTYSFRGSFYNFHYFTTGYHNTWIHEDVIQEKPN
ncbi:POTRA domain-containing protein, partial [uncultured Cyclobacterium sp.]|uniref:POTRA domain-containing protein n=1 Tax=uncultured Cyclobacterium sp. TaxID=453820 RepID=UPI0030EE672E